MREKGKAIPAYEACRREAENSYPQSLRKTKTGRYAEWRCLLNRAYTSNGSKKESERKGRRGGVPILLKTAYEGDAHGREQMGIQKGSEEHQPAWRDH